MAVCSVCKAQLAEGDLHFGCLLHRSCTRQAPCSLDADEPPEYWDEVESLTTAIRSLSPDTRSSSRILAQKQGSKKARSASAPPSTVVNPPISIMPPLAPLGDGGKKDAGKRGRVRKGGNRLRIVLRSLLLKVDQFLKRLVKRKRRLMLRLVKLNLKREIRLLIRLKVLAPNHPYLVV